MYIATSIIVLIVCSLQSAAMPGTDDTNCVSCNELLCLYGKINEKIDMLNETIHSLLSSSTGPDTAATLDPPTIGKLKKTITGISSPWYITIADDGIAYLTDSHAKKLHKLDSEGKILKTACLFSWLTSWDRCQGDSTVSQ